MMVKGGESPTEYYENGEVAQGAVCHLAALGTPWGPL